MLVSERLHKRPTFKLPSAAFAEQYTGFVFNPCPTRNPSRCLVFKCQEVLCQTSYSLGLGEVHGEVEALTVEVNRTISVQFFKPGAILVLKTISTPPRTTHDRIYRRAYKHSKYTYLRFGSIANSSCYIFLWRVTRLLADETKGWLTHQFNLMSL